MRFFKQSEQKQESFPKKNPFKGKRLFYFLTFVVILNNEFSIETIRVLHPSADQYLCIIDGSKDKELSEKSHCDKATENCENPAEH